MSTQSLQSLLASESQVTSGIAEVLLALLSRPEPTELHGPILIVFGDRTIALGRKRMAGMNGRVCLSVNEHEYLSHILKNAFLYLKRTFGLLNATTPLYLQAVFSGSSAYVEVDTEAWEELVPYIVRLRIVVSMTAH